MEEDSRPSLDVPVRLEYLRVKNYRVLQDLELTGITPLTAFAGPNGSGKSTLFDVLAFLQEAFTTSLKQAIENRYGLRELRSRGQSGPIEIEIRVRFEDALLAYEIAFDEQNGAPVVLHELGTGLEMDGSPIDERIITVTSGEGWVWEGGGIRVRINFPDKSELAAPLVGRIGSNGWIIKLRKFLSDWYLSLAEPDDVRHISDAGPQRRLSRSGNNLANVLEWLAEHDSASLDAIERRLRQFIPRLDGIVPVATGDGRSMLQLRDLPFEGGIPARFASDGSLNLLAYMTILSQAGSFQLVGFEEPERYMSPHTLYPIMESMREAAGGAQILVNTHSTTILNSFRPEEVWMLYRNEDGFAKALRASHIRGVKEAMDEGAALGNLWLQGFLRVGDPTKNHGMPVAGFGDI